MYFSIEGKCRREMIEILRTGIQHQAAKAVVAEQL